MTKEEETVRTISRGRINTHFVLKLPIHYTAYPLGVAGGGAGAVLMLTSLLYSPIHKCFLLALVSLCK